MCGIFCMVIKNSTDEANVNNYLQKAYKCLETRGPDCKSYQIFQVSDSLKILFVGTTLHLRGKLPTQQPICDKHGNVLLWNGEIFDGLNVLDSENDGMVLLKHLSDCLTDVQVLETIGRIKGPYSFVYWQSSNSKLWFGRDVLGRRSLLGSFRDDELLFSSVSLDSQDNWMEIMASGIYCLDLCVTSDEKSNADLSAGNDIIELKNDLISFSHSLTLHPWLWSHEEDLEKVSLVQLVSESEMFNYDPSKSLINSLIVSDLGLKCPFFRFNKLYEELDLSSVVDVDSLSNQSTDTRTNALELLFKHLLESVRKRTSTLPNLCSQCLQAYFAQSLNINKLLEPDQNLLGHLNADASIESSNIYHSNDCIHSKVAVLFSGGIDSLVIAALVDKCIPENESIDLLNVSFADTKGKKNIDLHALAPDRITGLDGLNELKLIAPRRKWNFVEINVSLEELQEKRQESVRHLIQPLETVLDDSIGCALWFAARGQGSLKGEGQVNDLNYTSPARVVLLGMGADELLAGYSRHRMRFMTGGWSSLSDELELEIRNISSRNMGRDDRIVSDHSREARFPYLDENVVRFLMSLKMNVKFDLRLPRGVGEKLLLRLLAKKLGLSKGAQLHKRAIQFGSRIAKLEGRKEKASEKCNRLFGDGV